MTVVFLTVYWLLTIVITFLEKNRLSHGVGILVLVKKLLNVSVREVTIPNKYCDTEIVATDLSDDSEVMHF